MTTKTKKNTAPADDAAPATTAQSPLPSLSESHAAPPLTRPAPETANTPACAPVCACPEANDTTSPTVQRYKFNTWQDIAETLAEEIAVQVSYLGGSKKLWAWPQNLPALVAGHVLLDCLPQANALRSAQVEKCAPFTPARPAYSVSLRSYAGPPPPVLPLHIHAQDLLEHMTAFIKAPGLWDNTGCFHRAAMLDMHTGRIVHVAEDIGRHNCVDRLAGYAALTDPAGLHPSAYVLLISSRITASLYRKARRAGFCCMVSRSAVTTGSMNAAIADGCTLVGFCRPEESRLTVFADPLNRINE